MFVCCECCVFVRYRSLRRADHSSRGVLSTVVRPCVWSRNLKTEEAKTRKWVVKASERRRRSVLCYLAFRDGIRELLIAPAVIHHVICIFLNWYSFYRFQLPHHQINQRRL
jgi:hypothetical protein